VEPHDDRVKADLRAENKRLAIEVGLLRHEKHALEDRLAAVIAEHRAREHEARQRRRWFRARW
jgi:hypothetical protein